MDAIAKTLSRNDAGETGAHQAGLLIPQKPPLLSFFPALNVTTKNPRVHIQFETPDGEELTFAFIYYNNKRFNEGTRNEYRLTRMTRFIREAGLSAGDEVIFHRSSSGKYFVEYRRKNDPKGSSAGIGRTVLTLGSGWRTVKI